MKALYIFLTVVLMLILSFIIHAAVELVYLGWAESAGVEIIWANVSSKSCALPLWLVYILPIAAIIFGVFLGFFWWKKIYRD